MSLKNRSKSTDVVASVKHNFMHKFKGKANFVSKEGVLCILFKNSEEE